MLSAYEGGFSVYIYRIAYYCQCGWLWVLYLVGFCKGTWLTRIW